MKLVDNDIPPELRLPQGNSVCTEACYKFQRQHHEIFDFFFFGMKLAKHSDFVRVTAAEALAKSENPEYRQSSKDVKEDPEPAFRKFRSFASYQSEIMVTRSVDNFLWYVSTLLQTCMIKRPEILRSKEQIKTEDILKFSKRADLVQFLIDRKVNELSYGGLRRLEEFLDQSLGMPLFSSEDERTLVTIAVELRNIYIHNRGIVNELFLSRLKDREYTFTFIERERFHTDFDLLVNLTNALFDAATTVDLLAMKKFKLHRKRYNTWDAPRLVKDS
jgi:hypothetical protein